MGGALKLSTTVLFLVDLVFYFFPNTFLSVAFHLPSSEPLSVWHTEKTLFASHGAMCFISLPSLMFMMPKFAALASGSWSLMAAQCVGSAATIFGVFLATLLMTFSVNDLGIAQLGWSNAVLPAMFFVAVVYLGLA